MSKVSSLVASPRLFVSSTALLVMSGIGSVIFSEMPASTSEFSCGGGPFSFFMASLVSTSCNRDMIHMCCEAHDRCYEARHLNQTFCDRVFCGCLDRIASSPYCENVAHPSLCLATEVFGHLFHWTAYENASATLSLALANNLSVTSALEATAKLIELPRSHHANSDSESAARFEASEQVLTRDAFNALHDAQFSTEKRDASDAFDDAQFSAGKHDASDASHNAHFSKEKCDASDAFDDAQFSTDKRDAFDSFHRAHFSTEKSDVSKAGDADKIAEANATISQCNSHQSSQSFAEKFAESTENEMVEEMKAELKLSQNDSCRRP